MPKKIGQDANLRRINAKSKIIRLYAHALLREILKSLTTPAGWPRGGVVTQRTANPFIPVRFWARPPTVSPDLIIWNMALHSSLRHTVCVALKRNFDPEKMMLDYQKTRQNMVDCQIRTNDVTNHALLSAFLQVPRERFVPGNIAELAYIDEDIAVGKGRYLMEPAPFAKLAQAAGIGADDIVLDIGCATGYSSAVFSRFASVVIALEEDSDLAAHARKTLDDLDYDNVAVVEGPLAAGYLEESPYDVIFVNGAVEELPSGLFNQLKDDGKLIAVEGLGNSAVAKMYSKSGSDISGRILFNCAVEPLPGFEKTPEFVF